MVQLAIWLVSVFIVFYAVMLAITAFGAAVVWVITSPFRPDDAAEDARRERLAHEAARRVKRRAAHVAMTSEQIKRHTAALYLDLCTGRLA